MSLITLLFPSRPFSLTFPTPLHNSITMSFGDLKSAAGLKKLEAFLADKSYLEG